MPDNISGLYPQAPPQQQQGALSGDPLRLIGALQGIQNLRLQQQQFPALAQQPAAALAGQNISNVTAQQEQDAKAMAIAAGAYGSLSNQKNPGSDAVHNITAWLSTATHIPSDRLNAIANQILKDPDGIPAGAAKFQAYAMGPGGASAPVTAPPSPAGTPQQTPAGRFVVDAAGSGTGATATAPPPGFIERQTGAAISDVKLAGGLSDAAEGSQARRAILGNLDDLVDKFTSGPGADWTKVAKSFVNRNVPLPAGMHFDPKSIASQEEFNKQAVQLAQQQFGAIGGTGTDAKFASAFETSPNDALSPLGNKGIIRLLKGNEDALQAKNEAWLGQSEKDPSLSYRRFSSSFNTNFDPRVYQFKYMNQAERKEYFGAMNPDEQDRFLHAYKYAKDNKYVNYGMAK